MHLQVVLLNDETGPDAVEQLGLGHRAAAPLDECQEQVERARAERRRLAFDEDEALARADLDACKTEDVGHGIFLRRAGRAPGPSEI